MNRSRRDERAQTGQPRPGRVGKPGSIGGDRDDDEGQARQCGRRRADDDVEVLPAVERQGFAEDRKSTRLNSSHLVISYAVFCLKKKKYSKSYICIANTIHITSLSI